MKYSAISFEVSFIHSTNICSAPTVCHRSCWAPCEIEQDHFYPYNVYILERISNKQWKSQKLDVKMSPKPKTVSTKSIKE